MYNSQFRNAIPIKSHEHSKRAIYLPNTSHLLPSAVKPPRFMPEYAMLNYSEVSREVLISFYLKIVFSMSHWRLHVDVDGCVFKLNQNCFLCLSIAAFTFEVSNSPYSIIVCANPITNKSLNLHLSGHIFKPNVLFLLDKHSNCEIKNQFSLRYQSP